ncbi:MAG: ABC transporter substrate-binding protein [Pseudobdellovibrionaceae bacterium]|nr:ABC transporter substrate-binding protein [Pseudobdellovibrionaceae bacterium]
MLRWLFALVLGYFAGLQTGYAEVWKMAAAEWPPYFCDRACPENGAIGKALRETLKKVSIEVEYTFFPWSRAIRETRAGRFQAFLPAWPQNCPDDFFFSDPLYISPVGLIERKAKPAKIEVLADLKHYLVGVVQDYDYTKEFQDLMRKGTVRTQMVHVEHLNLKILANDRVDVIIMDLVNFNFYMKTSFQHYKDDLQANRFVIDKIPLGLCFPKGKGHDQHKKLREALKKADAGRIVSAYIKQYAPQASP